MNIFLDAHEDLAANMASFGRDYTRSAFHTRQLEQNSTVPERTGSCLIGWPEYQRANIAIVFSTLFASPKRRVKAGEIESQSYTTIEQAHQLYWQQLLSYHRLCEEHPDLFRLIGTRAQLQEHLALWQSIPEPKPVGLVPLMEGAEGLRSPDELYEWWQAGLRIIGLAWAGNRFCGGTREPGPLSTAGRELLVAMAEQGFILDLAHMDAQAAFEALDLYPGHIIASHANASALVKGYNSNRLLSDELIRALIARDGVIGVVPYNAFLDASWKQCDGRQAVPLRMVAEQIDYICQLSGDCQHVGIGTDFDGGFGLESVPLEIESIADLPKLNPLLANLGYSEEDLAMINAGNFLRVIDAALP